MKTVATALLLTMFVAAPAIAEQRHKMSPQAAAAQASVPYDQSPWSTNPNAVIVNGKVLRQDPDPAIRTQLLRQGDPTEWNSGN
jgi:hypothetical protein